MSHSETSLRKFFWKVIKPYKGYLIGILLSEFYWAIHTTLSPYVLKLIIDKTAAFSGDKMAFLDAVKPEIILYCILWGVVALDMRIIDWLRLKLLPALRYDLINNLFSYLTQHSHRYFQNNFAGSLSNKISDMTSGTNSLFITGIEVLVQSIALLIAIVSMFLVHPLFGFILLGWALAFIFIARLYLKHIHGLSNILAASNTSLVGKLVDSVSNVINLRLFSRHAYENEFIRAAAQDTINKDRSLQWMLLKVNAFWDVSLIILITINLYALCILYTKNQVSIGDFSFILSLSTSIFFGLVYLAKQFSVFAEQLGKCKQALTIVSEAHEIVDLSDAKPLIVSEGRIEFKNVSFHYNEGAPLFKNKNVVIERGEKVGLVGLSGSGKTTFVNLILRLFDIESGKILIDGQDISQVTQKSLREQMGMIPQDVTLFHRSLMDNIRYGRIEASDEEVIEASKKAHCHEFIIQLKEGYHSLVGERGIKLSGGQRQRIAIARAILKNAPIFILDEATSALDSLTEQLIQEGLHLLMAGRTTIVIAHRLSTLSEMDRILVFDKGQIIEEGSPEALIKAQGHYSRMWKMQAGGFLPDTL
jgi:ATP-binding cassette subfamily B protein